MKYAKLLGPKITYPVTIEKNGTYSDIRTCTNIMRSVRFREILKSNGLHFYPYIIHDDDRPDIIAHKYYGSSDYAWVVLLVNNILDPFYDWPLTYPDFVAYMQKKYGSLEYPHQNIKYYLNANGYQIDFETWDELPVAERDQRTIFEWEEETNEAKRQIQLLDKVYLSKVLNEFRDLMKNA